MRLHKITIFATVLIRTPMNNCCQANHPLTTGKIVPAYAWFFPVSRTIALIALILFFSSFLSVAQTNKNYSIQANIIYHFTKYIDWPQAKKTGDFIIGVVGDSPIYEALKESISHKLVNGRKIVIKKYSSSDIFDCHILFISEDESRYIKKISAQTQNSATLLVSEEEGLAKKGSCINFIVVNQHLKLEINKRNIQQRKLEIATELLQLGTEVK